MSFQKHRFFRTRFTDKTLDTKRFNPHPSPSSLTRSSLVTTVVASTITEAVTGGGCCFLLLRNPPSAPKRTPLHIEEGLSTVLHDLVWWVRILEYHFTKQRLPPSSLTSEHKHIRNIRWVIPDNENDHDQHTQERTSWQTNICISYHQKRMIRIAKRDN